MLISTKSLGALNEALKNNMDTYCSGLYLSARWNRVANIKDKRLNFIVLPNRDAAEYCASDLYNFTEGDSVFFLPDSAVNLQKSNFKDTAAVQRTAAISEISLYKKEKAVYIVTYPEAIEEGIPSGLKKAKPLLSFKVGDEASHAEVSQILCESGFERVDFVSAPGQFSLRGGIIDIFSYDNNYYTYNNYNYKYYN